MQRLSLLIESWPGNSTLMLIKQQGLLRNLKRCRRLIRCCLIQIRKRLMTSLVIQLLIEVHLVVEQGLMVILLEKGLTHLDKGGLATAGPAQEARVGLIWEDFLTHLTCLNKFLGWVPLLEVLEEIG